MRGRPRKIRPSSPRRRVGRPLNARSPLLSLTLGYDLKIDLMTEAAALASPLGVYVVRVLSSLDREERMRGASSMAHVVAPSGATTRDEGGVR